MGDAPVAAVPQPCCVCDAPGGKQCTKCKSRHYCSKACQLFDWKEGGHNKACKQLAAKFQDRLLDEMMPAKLKIKEEPAIVEDVLLADGTKAAARLSAVRAENAPVDNAKARLSAVGATAVVKASAPNDGAPDWRGTCAVCLDLLPLRGDRQTLYMCCIKRLCTECSNKCRQHDKRCPLCRAPAPTSVAEAVRRLQKHVDRGNAEAQEHLAAAYRTGGMGLKASPKRAFELYQLSAAQGHALAQAQLGIFYAFGNGVKMNPKTAAMWLQRAAEQGQPASQYTLGTLFSSGSGVAQSHTEAVKWWRLAAAEGDAAAPALYKLGVCYEYGEGVQEDLDEALRLYKRAAAQGSAEAAAAVGALEAHRVYLEAHRV